MIGVSSAVAWLRAPVTAGSVGVVICATASTTVTTSPGDACTAGAAAAACCCCWACWNDGSARTAIADRRTGPFCVIDATPCTIRSARSRRPTRAAVPGSARALCPSFSSSSSAPICTRSSSRRLRTIARSDITSSASPRDNGWKLESPAIVIGDAARLWIAGREVAVGRKREIVAPGFFLTAADDHRSQCLAGGQHLARVCDDHRGITPSRRHERGGETEADLSVGGLLGCLGFEGWDVSGCDGNVSWPACTGHEQAAHPYEQIPRTSQNLGLHLVKKGV